MNLSIGTLFSPVAWAVLFFIALLLVRSAFRAEPGEVACSWKFRTVIYVSLSLLIPLWPLTFPIFLHLAHRSYLAGARRSSAAA
ncbi:hypothetical protein V3596_20695 [Roseateles sp. MS17]